jgi:hypothetical protein
MTSKQLQQKINNLKLDVLARYTEGKKLKGVCLFFEGSSENWIFNTDVNITPIVPTVTQALEKEIAQLEEELKPVLEEEAKQAAIQAEIDAKAEAERLAKEQAEAEIKAIEDGHQKRVEIGNKLIKIYLLDNSLLNLTTQQSLEQLQKFSAIKMLLELGSLKAAKDLIFMSEVDEVFTQERKNKYLSYL